MLQRDTVTTLYLIQNWTGNTLVKVSDRYDTYLSCYERVKPKKCNFSWKFDLWPDLTSSNVDLGLKTICAIARYRRDASTVFFREALRPSGADRQGGHTYQPTNQPPPLAKLVKYRKRARVNIPILFLVCCFSVIAFGLNICHYYSLFFVCCFPDQLHVFTFC